MASTDDASSARSTARRPDRRQFLRLAGGVAAVGPLAGALAACGSGSGAGSGTQRALRIGYVSPQTGALSPFGAADSFVIDQMRDRFRGGIPLGGGVNWPLDIIVRDSQSDTAEAGNVATELILQDQIDLMLVASTPETVNPVSDQCEAYGVPCISTVAPWQSWYYGRRNLPPPVADKNPFVWTHHFFWGLDDLEGVYADIWKGVETNKKVGALFPKDSDGDAFGNSKIGFPVSTKKDGYTLLDPQRFADLTSDYSTQIRQFQQASADIVVGVPQPPDFASFWNALQRAGTYRPKVVTVAKALLFPDTVKSLGAGGNNLCSEVWWSPSHPFSSSLTGDTAKTLAALYEKVNHEQWTQPIGFVHALFEVAAAALGRVTTPADRQRLTTAIGSLKQPTVVGIVDFTAGPNPSVATTPLVGGQWRQSQTSISGFDLAIVTDTEMASIPLDVDPRVRPITSAA